MQTSRHVTSFPFSKPASGVYSLTHKTHTAGTSTFTIRVQDSGTPQQSDQIAIQPHDQRGLVRRWRWHAERGECTNQRRRTFVADPQFTQINLVAGLATVTWSELSALPGPHGENVGVALDHLTGQVLSLTMNEGVGLVFTSWQCALPPGFPCTGVTVNRATGTASITNTVLQDVGGTGAPPITLNGTLTFTPF